MEKRNDAPRYRYRLPPCPAYDVEGTERWLSEMAAQGLMLAPDGFFFGIVTLEESEPCHARYRLEAIPKGSFFDDNATPDAEAVELAAHYGWEYVAKRGEFYIYRTVQEDARELNTDPRVRALAMKAVRARQRGYLFEWLWWLVLYPLLQNRALVWRMPLLATLTLGSWLSLFTVLIVGWLGIRAIVRTVMLERLYRRLSRGETIGDGTADGTERARRIRRHRICSVTRVTLTVIWAVWLSVWTLYWMTDQGEVPIEEYIEEEALPFASLAEIASCAGEVAEYRAIRYGFGNTVKAWQDPLAPVNIDYCEIAEVKLADGRSVEGALYVTYHETVSPALAVLLAKEYHRGDRAKKNYGELGVDLPTVSYAVAYLDEVHRPTVLLQEGNRVMRVSFYAYSSSAEIPIERWAQIFADGMVSHK